MKYKFYLEYPSDKERELATVENLGNHSETVLAVPEDEVKKLETKRVGDVRCFGERVYWKTCGVCSCSPLFLVQGCLEIPEETAREIHPALFTFLDKLT